MGTYEVRAELDGFAPVSRTDFTLTPGGRDTVSFLLIPSTTETLSVIARTAHSPSSSVRRCQRDDIRSGSRTAFRSSAATSSR